MPASPRLSLIVATKGRAAPFRELFASLETQDFRDFEVVVVDQNADDRVGEPEAEGWSFPVRRLRTPQESGASRARNAGLRAARGAILLFPDDDCWYPPHFLGEALARMAELSADVLAGRAAAQDGRDINGRYEQGLTRIGRGNVWTTGIEWVMFFKREVLTAVGGYDVAIGVGAATPWQACECQDIVLRVLDQGFSCWFDPAVYGHHVELDVRSPAMRTKGRAYARGFGYVLRRHGFPRLQMARWLLRPAVRGVLALVRGDRAEATYCGNVVAGRYEGFRMRVAGATAPAGDAVAPGPVA